MIEQPWGGELPPVSRGRLTPGTLTQRETEPSAAASAETLPEKKPAGTGRVLAVQCIACVVALLLVLLLRTAGGAAYTQLRESFHQSLMRNDLLATLARLWDGDPAQAVSGQLESRNDQASAAGGNETSGNESQTEENRNQTSENTQDTSDNNNDEAAADDGKNRSDDRQNSSSAENSETPSAAGTSAGRLPPEGALAVPLLVNRAAVPPLRAGTLTSGYGYRDSPTGGAEQFHWGVDIAAPAGTPIAAMFFGTVAAAGENPSFGNYVRLTHGDGVEVLYAHCSRLLVSAGTVVRPGETVALVGATGAATGNHLHVQVSYDGTVYHPAGMVPLERYVRRA